MEKILCMWNIHLITFEDYNLNNTTSFTQKIRNQLNPECNDYICREVFK